MKSGIESLEEYPLSSQQCSVHVDDWQEDVPVQVVLVEGPSSDIQAETLQVALDRMIERHEILRTCYRSVVGLCYPVQYVRPYLASVWKACDSDVDDDSLMQLSCSLLNLQEGPVMGSALSITSDGRLRWALAISSYSVDSRALQELVLACLKMCVAHNGEESPSDEAVQYPDYVAWQSDLRSSDLGQEGLRFWENQAAIASKPPRLPFEIVSPNMERQTESFALSDKAQVAINSLSERLSIDSETLMVALWAGFMARVMQTDSLSFSWHADVRTEELQGAFGCFTMILPVTLEFKSEMPTEAILRSATSQLQSAALWQECFDSGMYADHLTNLNTNRRGIEFAYIRVLQLPAGWAFRHIRLEPGDSCLQCLCFDEGGQRVLRWQGMAKYLPGTLQMWMCQFIALLESVGRCLEQPWMNQPMLGHTEREKILRAARASRFEKADRSPRTLHGLFEEQVKRMPEKLAVVCGNERLTYRNLNNRANTIARRLRHHGVEIEQCVGICLGRSVDMIGAMLAVLKCGAAYVPLDPSYPEERINDMLAGADISVVIATTIDQERFSDSEIRYVSIEESSEDIGEDLPEEKVAPDHLAYAVYTSGSTGKPKGVMVSHANAVASTLARFRFYRTLVERFLLLSSSSFDSSVAGIYWTLGQGGTLYLPIEGMHYDPTYITELISRESISHLLALPSLYKQILNDIEDAAGFKCAIVAGEACHSDVVDLHKRKLPAVELVNEYGPAEGTVWSNAYRFEHGCVNDMRVPIGRTIDSTYGYVLDDRLELCPVGMPGEWYIGGDGVARGYVGRPALTAHRFVADPFGSGERLYRTGDRVRVRPDGELEYLGRVDNQVKLRGYRIELDEIEGVLRSHQGVREAAVIVHGDDQLNQQLVGFFATAGESSDIKHQALREELLEYLRRALPAFMVPTLIIPVASLPLMPNGKVDRPALIALIDQGARAPYVPPADDTERALAQIWQSVLKVERVGVKDNFFDLGGHSLLATQVTSRIRQTLAVDLPLKDLFEAKTLGELAVQVRDLIDASRDEFSVMESIIAGNEE